MSIIIFAVIIIALVLVHELGHFSVAKFFGIRVDEFGFGFPPKIFGVKKGETTYSINAIPFGGFVRIFGENGEVEDKNAVAGVPNALAPDAPATNAQNPDARKSSGDPRSFVNKKRPIQALVLFAGVAANFIFAWILISFGFMSGLPMPASDYPEYAGAGKSHVIVLGVLGESPAESAGLKPGDLIEKISTEGKTIELPKTSEVQSAIKESSGREITLGVWRGSEMKEISITPEQEDGNYAIGISIDELTNVKMGFFKSFVAGAKISVMLTERTFEGLYDFFGSFFKGRPMLSEVQGPIGIISLVSEAGAFGFGNILALAAIISINLAIINLVPFPALDGGRLLFVAVESVIRRPLNKNFSRIANGIGFAILIALMVAVTWKDIAAL